MLTLLSKLVLGAAVAADQAIHLHPIAIAGCLGLVVTALNLMPVGQLDAVTLSTPCTASGLRHCGPGGAAAGVWSLPWCTPS
jgi:hypothetical protein